MSQPMWISGPPAGEDAPARGAVLATLAVLAGTVLLGVAVGFAWAALAPRPLLVMTGPQAAAVANPETGAFIAADAVYVGLSLAGGAVAGLAVFLLAVRRWGPMPMAGLLVGALVAAFLARWIGEQSGLAAFHHLLATLPVNARLRAPLTLGAASALAFWPLAAGLVAGGLTALASREPAGPPPLGGPLLPGSPPLPGGS